LTESAFASQAHQIGAKALSTLKRNGKSGGSFWPTLDARKPFRDFVYCSRDGDGSPMYVKASGKPVFDTNGEFRGYRGTGANVARAGIAYLKRNRSAD
jgi:hypothetical protein